MDVTTGVVSVAKSAGFSAYLIRSAGSWVAKVLCQMLGVTLFGLRGWDLVSLSVPALSLTEVEEKKSPMRGSGRVP